MNLARIAAAASLAFGLVSQAAADELSVATFVPPQHHTNQVMFKWFGEELEKRSGGSLTMKLYPAELSPGPCSTNAPSRASPTSPLA